MFRRSNSNQSRTDFVWAPHPGGIHRFCYREWGPVDAEEVVVAVHGLTRNGHDFDRLAARLAPRFRVVAVDMVGRGVSDWLPITETVLAPVTTPQKGMSRSYLQWLQASSALSAPAYGYPQYMSDIWVLLARLNAQKLYWLGTSMGGILGMMAAAVANSPVQKLILNDIGGSIPYQALKDIGHRASLVLEWDSVAAAEAAYRQRYDGFGIDSDADWQALTRHSVVETGSGRYRAHYDPAIGRSLGTFYGDVHLWPLYDAITCPTLVIRGEHSDVLPRRVWLEMAQRGPHAALVEFAACGHAPALLQADQITAVADFLGAEK